MGDTKSQAHGRELPSDEDLLYLELALESGQYSNHSSNRCTPEDDHQRAYQFINDVSAPIRNALVAIDQPPQLDDYGPLTELARGGMGVVYAGQHKTTGRVDAIKVIRPDRLAGLSTESIQLLRLRFQQETKLAARVAHEHIVPVYQVGETQDCAWYSMQLVDGKSLHELSRDERITPERIVECMEQIARAIDRVHRHGILHGDIKPHNILIERETNRAMITDFGLADLESNDDGRSIAGTPAYMAPELASGLMRSGSEEVVANRSIASDVYSIGATLWAALAGCSPCYPNRTPSQQVEDVANGNLRFFQQRKSKLPPDMQRIIRKCLVDDPDKRYVTAGVLADDLAAWLDRPRWNRHFPGLRNLLWMVVAPVLLISGVIVSWLRSIDAAEQWVWLVILGGYIPLFATFLASQRRVARAIQARRELWSIWTGHLISTLACILSLRILCAPNIDLTIQLFYPCWAAISSLVFFAKSGNFWKLYRWIGLLWASIALLLAVAPNAPVLFGALAAATCLFIAKGDRSFMED